MSLGHDPRTTGIAAFTNYLGPILSTYALKLQEEGKSIVQLGMRGFTDEVLCSKGCQKEPVTLEA